MTGAAALVGMGLATVERVLDAAVVADVAPAFGEMRGPLDGVRVVADAVHRFTFHDAVVHGAEGVVTVGRHVVAESLHQVWPTRVGAVREGDAWVMTAVPARVRLDAAEHLLCGNSGNYFHWLLDGVVRCVVAGAGVVLVPGGAAFHGGVAALAPGLASRMVVPGKAIEVGRLGWTTSMNGAGAAFHPAVLEAGRAVVGGAGGADLYVARTDAANRPLRNEAAVMAACVTRGFRAVTLSGMGVGEQARLFAGARRIVAPHGAGLANLVFARPGAAVLELVTDAYANPCFRRLAATAGVRYGCLTGRAEDGGAEAGWIHFRGWSLDVEQLAGVLDDPAFVQEET